MIGAEGDSLWSRMLSPVAREHFAAWTDEERQWALDQAQALEVVEEPELALVVGELQLLANKPWRLRWWYVAIELVWGVWGVLLLSFADHVLQRVLGAFLIAAAGMAVVAYKATRPRVQVGVDNLAHAADHGLEVAYRFREAFPELETAHRDTAGKRH